MAYAVTLTFSPLFVAWATFGFLQFLGFLLVAIGLSVLVSDCKNSSYNSSRCAGFYSSEWFALFFQLLVLVFVALSGIRQALKRFRLVLSVFVTIATTQLLHHGQAHAFGVSLARLQYQFHLTPSAAGACAAGFIIMSLVNLIFFVVVGSDTPPDVRPIQTWVLRRLGIVHVDGKKSDMEEGNCLISAVKHVPLAGNDTSEGSPGDGGVRARVQSEVSGGDDADGTVGSVAATQHAQ